MVNEFLKLQIQFFILFHYKFMLNVLLLLLGLQIQFFYFILHFTIFILLYQILRILLTFFFFLKLTILIELILG